MAVEPNSTLRLLSNVPLNLTYENTIYFDSKAAQANYFIGKTVKTFNDLSYQRVSSNTIRVECNADDIQNCNYMMFINRNYGAKWFYAFITDIRYINDNTTEVDYVLDDLQSYLKDITLKECFVEREHSSTDSAGDNTIPEDIDVPAYRYTNTKVPTGLFDGYTLAMISTCSKDNDGNWSVFDAQSCLVNNVPMCLSVQYVQNVKDSDPSKCIKHALHMIKNDLSHLDVSILLSIEQIASIYPIPTSFVLTTNFTEGMESTAMRELPTGISSTNHVVTEHKPTALGGYVPRNKKLLTYPFNKLVCNTYNDWQEYRYEWFTNDKIEFAVYASLLAPVAFKAAPKLYYGDNINEAFSVTMEGIPSTPFGVTGVADWIIKTGAKLAVQGVETFIGFNQGISAGNDLINKGTNSLTAKKKQISSKGKKLIERGEKTIEATKENTFGEVTNSVASLALHGATPNINSSSSGHIEFSTHEKDFFFFQVYPKEEYSAIIDDYFDLYGYATKRVKVPNIHVRKAWTYTKTVNAVVVGGAPASALENIANIFNNGIRFWNSGDSVGVYTINGVHVDNSPL